MKCWCPYTNTELEIGQTTPEHIIPLALGGSNQFSIRVEKATNAKVGSSIDGKLSNEFMISLRRAFFNTRGHSNVDPIATLKNSTFGITNEPCQIRFTKSEGPVIWDARRRRNLEPHELTEFSTTSKVKFDRFSRLRFMSKAALSGGYFVYGDEFRYSFQVEDLRTMMKISMPTSENFEHVGLRVYDEFSDIHPDDAEQVTLDKTFCESISGSCVMMIPGESSVGFIFGLLGQWIGSLNVPANTNNLPNDDEHDLGHVVAIEQGKMRRLSYRQMAREVLEKISLQNPV